MKISVVIPLFNKALYIERALHSVLSQTMTDLELIVIDDGSTDNGGSIVKSFTDGRIRLIRQENRGVSAAKNQGIAEAKTELIALLDADDEWRPNFLETICRLRIEYPQAGLYATAYEIQEPSGRFVPKWGNIPAGDWEGILPNFFAMMLGEPAVCSSAVAVPKAVLSQVGEFLPQKAVGGDQELWCRIALRYPVAFSRKICAVYHKEVEQRISNWLVERVKFEETLLEKAAEVGVSEETITYIQEFIQKKRIRSASRFVLWGQPAKCRQLLRKCQTKMFWKEKWFWMALTYLPAALSKKIWHLKQDFLSRIRELKQNLHSSSKT